MGRLSGIGVIGVPAINFYKMPFLSAHKLVVAEIELETKMSWRTI